MTQSGTSPPWTRTVSSPMGTPTAHPSSTACRIRRRPTHTARYDRRLDTVYYGPRGFKPTMRPVTLFLLAIAAGAVGCTRWEPAPPGPEPGCPPALRSVGGLIETRYASLDSVTHPIVIQVVDSIMRRPLGSAWASVRGDTLVWGRSDSLGIARFDLTWTTSVVVEVQRLGFQTRRDSLVLPADRAVQMVVPLSPSPFDGPCSGFAIVMQKQPWWKFW